jgi:hypothetical protein
MATLLDTSAVHMMVARRLAREPNARQKLDLLGRLQRTYIECRLPRESETRVEQSFNEQLFAKVFGYRTLFSHDALPYHLRPKNYASGARRYDDFSLGRFWGDERDEIVATAELKSPGTNLDAPQKDRDDRISPVEQAFRAARGFPGCRWVIVSNFRELRLYGVDAPDQPIIAVDLHEVRTRRQLARACAHFDRQALIGNGGKADMSVALDPNHPSAPLPAAENAFRLVCTFTPTAELELPLFAIYDAVRAAAVKLLGQVRPGLPPVIPTRLEDGWCAVDITRNKCARLAMSTEGQVRYTLLCSRVSSAAQINPDAGFFTIASHIRDFLGILESVHRESRLDSRSVEGVVSAELREINGWSVYFDGDMVKLNDETNYGIAHTDDAFSGDVLWKVGTSFASIVADCLAALALNFSHDNGSRVRFDHQALTRRVERWQKEPGGAE